MTFLFRPDCEECMMVKAWLDKHGVEFDHVISIEIEDEVIEFCKDKKAVLLLEEGQPNYIEQTLNTILRQTGIQTPLGIIAFQSKDGRMAFPPCIDDADEIYQCQNSQDRVDPELIINQKVEQFKHFVRPLSFILSI